MNACCMLFVASVTFLAFKEEKKAEKKDDDCASINQVEKKAKPYHFTFESWVKKADKGTIYIFGRCVQTKNEKTLFVDWKGAGVKGYAIPGFPVHNEVPSPTSDEVTVAASLWYGAAPTKMKAPYKEVKNKAEDSDEPLTSRVKMSIPRRVGKTPGDARDLIKINLVFVSEVKKKDGMYNYSYRWESSSPLLELKPIKFRWNSESVQKAAKKEGEKPPNFKVSEQPEQARLSSTAGPKYAITVVEFLDEAGKQVVGKASVAIYHPKDSKP